MLWLLSFLPAQSRQLVPTMTSLLMMDAHNPAAPSSVTSKSACLSLRCYLWRDRHWADEQSIPLSHDIIISLSPGRNQAGVLRPKSRGWTFPFTAVCLIWRGQSLLRPQTLDKALDALSAINGLPRAAVSRIPTAAFTTTCPATAISTRVGLACQS